ncbi:MAG: toxin-antitoxin system HicB family antitoxin [Spirochaetota bacterium]|nr:toxin-antitoxin system HicB family antitoxin [Spirochaetota bacterium]
MKTKASVLTLRIPFELKHNIKLMAEQQGISINQLALYALTKEMKSMETYNYLERYWIDKPEGNLKKNYTKVLEKIKEKNNNEVLPQWDRLD